MSLEGRSRGRGRGIRLPETPLNSPIVERSSKSEPQPVFFKQNLPILSSPESPKEIFTTNQAKPQKINPYKPLYNPYIEEDDQCEICDRPNKNVLCKTCGHNWKVTIKFINLD